MSCRMCIADLLDCLSAGGNIPTGSRDIESCAWGRCEFGRHGDGMGEIGDCVLGGISRGGRVVRRGRSRRWRCGCAGRRRGRHDRLSGHLLTRYRCQRSDDRRRLRLRCEVSQHGAQRALLTSLLHGVPLLAGALQHLGAGAGAERQTVSKRLSRSGFRLPGQLPGCGAEGTASRGRLRLRRTTSSAGWRRGGSSGGRADRQYLHRLTLRRLLAVLLIWRRDVSRRRPRLTQVGTVVGRIGK